MSTENVLLTVESKFGDVMNVERIKALHDAGDLKPFLPAECWWEVRVNDDEQLQYLKAVPTASLFPRLDPPIRHGDLQIIRVRKSFSTIKGPIMNLGNVLPAMEAKFGTGINIDRLNDLYHAGELKPFLPDGCWWTARADENGGVLSMETIATGDLEPYPATPRSDGGLHIRIDRADETWHLSYSFFPECELQERLCSQA